MSRPPLKPVSNTISENLVKEFVDATVSINSPELFRKWGAISMIASAMERKVWVHTRGSNLYPNMYIVLCAPPGIGKTAITAPVRDYLETLEEHHIGGNSLSKASLIDELDDAKRRIIQPGKLGDVMSFNALSIISNELGVLIPAYENEFMNALTDIYDGKGYAERKRTKDLQIKISKPNLNLLAACTPGYLREAIPPGAWDQGFLSRVIIVYSGEQEKRSLFESFSSNDKEVTHIKNSLEAISRLTGQFSFTDEAMKFIDGWYLSGGEPLPEHPKLAHYNTRRVAHLLKLSMVAVASRGPAGPEMTIDQADVKQALHWLIEAETYMPDIFKSMTSGGDSAVIEEAFHFLYQAYMKDGKTPVREARLVMFLQSRVAAHNIVRIIETMEKGGLVKKRHIAKTGTCYEPIKPEF